VSTRYEVTPNLALRATASTGFRAPTPGQLFSERTSQGLDTTTLNIFTAGRFSPQGPVAEVISKRDGVQINDLKPETSVNYSLGLAWDANNGLVTTVDLYQITIDDRFGSSPTFNPTAAEQAEFVALGVAGGEGITRVSFFQNDFDTETTGLDIVSSYAFDLDTGRLSLTAAYNYNQTEVTGGSLQGNETSRIRFEELLPQHNGSFSAVYDWGRFQFLGRARYYGSWTDFSFNAEGDIFQDFGAETFFDAAVTYAPNDLWSLRVGAENIFDTYPAEAEFQANRGLIYSRNAPYDTDGGYYYARVDVNF
jgi:iron complex outermembrane receptor protein